MKFVSWDYDQAVNEVAWCLAGQLAKYDSVLWLVSGGSNIKLQVAVMAELQKQSSDNLHKLSILPVDERYGPDGHSDSNYRAMKIAGFEPGGARWENVLLYNQDFERTIQQYNELSVDLLQAEAVVATLGIGADGHTAGILPHSPALVPTNLVTGYAANYDRMTLTPLGLRKITTAFVVAGPEKQPVINELRQANNSVDDMPAMLLYEIGDCTVVSIKGGDK